jgi:hypothetical protein
MFRRNEIKDKAPAIVRPKGLPNFMKADITFDLKTRLMISGLSSCL